MTLTQTDLLHGQFLVFSYFFLFVESFLKKKLIDRHTQEKFYLRACMVGQRSPYYYCMFVDAIDFFFIFYFLEKQFIFYKTRKKARTLLFSMACSKEDKVCCLLMARGTLFFLLHCIVYCLIVFINIDMY